MTAYLLAAQTEEKGNTAGAAADQSNLKID